MTTGPTREPVLRTVLVYDRPLFDVDDSGPVDAIRTLGPGSRRAGIGAHGFDQLFTSADAAVDVFVGSARTPVQQEIATTGPTTLTVGESDFEAVFVTTPATQYHSFSQYWSDQLLWLLLHGCWSGELDPGAGADFDATYVEVNRTIAEAVVDVLAADPRPTHVFWQDYQLWCAPGLMRDAARRRGLPTDRWRSSHFTHVPFPEVAAFRALPPEVVEQLLRGLLGNDGIGFQTRRDQANFLQACQELAGAEVDWSSRSVRVGDRQVRTGADAFPLDRVRLERLSAGNEVDAAERRLQERVAGRRLVLAVGRVDPVKDLPGTVRAFGGLLERLERPEEVFLLVQAQPSRLELEAWRREVEHLQAAVAEVVARFRDLPRPPVELDLVDSMAQAVAGYRSYDVLDVVPFADGLNLVCLEGIAINRTNGVVLLSEAAGAAELLGPSAVTVRPRDHQAHVSALATALAMPEAERRSRARRLRSASPSTTVPEWFLRQRRLADPTW